MIEMLPSPAIATRALNACKTTSETEDTVYELLSSEPLPKLDLSLPIKSRFLSHRALLKFNLFVRRRKEIGIVCYFLVLLTPVGMGHVSATLSALLYGPRSPAQNLGILIGDIRAIAIVFA